jgi:hypothetical protein
MVEIVRIGLWLLAAHVAIGAVFAVLFHRRGAAAIDPATHRTGWGFRLVITPGIIALWPLLALRWQRTASGRSFLGEPDAPVSPRRLRAVHGLAWKALAVVIPLVVAAALWWRPRDPVGGTLPAGLSASPWAKGTRSAETAQPTAPKDGPRPD